MDVNLLAQLLRELILDNDRVSLPGMGSFIADIAPAYFSEDGKTIFPPFRRIFFRTTEIWNDEIIEKYYAEKLHLDPDSVKTELQEFFEKFRLDLNVKKNIDLPGFGKMRSTKEGNYFFVAEKGLDIYANAFGLEPISLKLLTFDPNSKLKSRNSKNQDEGQEQEAVQMHSEELISEKDRLMVEAERDAENASSAVNAEMAEPEKETVYDFSEELSDISEEKKETAEVTAEENPQEEGVEDEIISETASVQEEEEDPVIMKRRKTIIIILSIVIAILVLVIILLIFKEPISDFLDSQLYSPQELELLKGTAK